MQGKMKAVVKYAEGPGNVELREVPIPQLGGNDALVKIKAVTVDMTDVDIWRWKPPMGVPVDKKEVKWMGRAWVEIPVILGAEIAGEVAKIGKNVEGWKEGDRVVVMYGLKPCGECVWCKLGRYDMCESRIQVGRMTDGGFAEYLKVPAESLVKIPDNISFIDAAPTEMVATAWHSFEKCGIDPGDFVVINGPGVVGNFACQIAKACGARKVLVTGAEGDKERLALAKKLGADITVDVTSEDLYEVVMGHTDGRGADKVLDFTGNPAAINKAFDIVRVHGTIHCTGNPRTGVRGEVTIPWLAINAKELRITGSKVWRARREEWEKLLMLMSDGRIKTAPLIQSKHPLEEWKEAFEERERKEVLLPVLLP